MKAAVIAVVIGAMAFAGLFFLMNQKPEARTDTVPVVSELPTSKRAPADAEEPATAKSRTQKSADAQAKKKTNFPTIGDAPPAKPAPPPKGLYYTVELTRKRGPVPSRVILHNTSFGDLTIMLIGAEDASGKLFGRSGYYDRDKVRHAWEVRVVENVLWVYWDGKEVPPDRTSF